MNSKDFLKAKSLNIDITSLEKSTKELEVLRNLVDKSNSEFISTYVGSMSVSVSKSTLVRAL